MEWLQSFAVYVSVIARKQPQRVPDLMGYQVLILEASSEYKNDCWMAYDRRFLPKTPPLNHNVVGPTLTLHCGY